MFRELHAEWEHFEAVHGAIGKSDCIPVAIGSGTINDLVKLAAHRLGRPYICIATAASMDGYTAYGASITKDGLKQTFDCPAPRAVVADIDIIAAAPNELTASGYADLLAKITAGADWIVADALGIEPLHAHAWRTVQRGLREAVADPAGVRRGDVDAITGLTRGLMMGGFAMQAMQSSRPASGAEHQFSHLWDMQNHVDPRTGEAPSHGFKVGIGTLAVARLYERLLAEPVEMLDIEDAARRWRDWPVVETSIRQLFDIPELRDKAIEETRAKYPSRDELVEQLVRLRNAWPDLKRRLLEQLVPSAQLATMLRDAGAPSRSEEIGISADRLRKSHRLAMHIRRRFTVLDLADRIGLLDA
jgi:glycerol-1-phosphate dehydrogenase [NAD(P)+]